MNKIFNFRTFFTFLSRNKTYTLITVFGFSVSLMFVILIGLYTSQEYSVDSQNSKADRIYCLTSESKQGGYVMGGSNWWFGKKLQSRYPEIEKTCAVAFFEDMKTKNAMGEVFPANILFTDSTFYSMFDFRLKEGDRATALASKDAAVISSALAEKLFGTAEPVGRTFLYGDSLRLKVMGVFDSMAGSCMPEADVVARFEQIEHFNIDMTAPTMNSFGGAELFVLVKPGTRLQGKADDMTKYFRTFSFVYQDKDSKMEAGLKPLKELYFSNVVPSATRRGNATMVSVLFAAGIAILLFSVMNYINLTVAQAGRRSREMATRRLFGAQRGEVVLRLVSESVLLCFVSFVFALLFALVSAPYAGLLLGTKLLVGGLLKPTVVACLIAFVLVVGIVAGLAPAFVISRPKPIDVVRGTFRHRTKMVLGKAFITIQNVITIVMLSASLTMVLQTHHLVNAPLGYDRDGLMSIPVPQDSMKTATFMSEISKLPQVGMVSKCMAAPVEGGYNNTFERDGKRYSIWRLFGDRNYLKILGIKVLQDNNNYVAGGAYVTRRFLNELHLKDNARFCKPYGEGQGEDRPTLILGIISDVKLGTIDAEYAKDAAVMVYIDFPYEGYYGNVLAKVSGDLVGAYDAVKDVYRHVYGEDLLEENPYIDQKVRQAYEGKIRLSMVVSLFAVVAVLISVMGLVAMSTYFIDQRRKETAIRKVFGSTDAQIERRLVGTFMLYVVLAFVVAAPLTMWIMGKWLQMPNYKTPVWPCLFGGAALCLAASLTAVYWQCRRASRMNPVERIKDNG